MYTIQDVDIVVTYPDDSTETFTLEAPNGENAFRFGFRKYPILDNYLGGDLSEQRGHIKYQFVGFYEYETHRMDARKLQVAKNIALKFPPYFTAVTGYQSVDVILQRQRLPKNYFQNLPIADPNGDVMPSGNLGLQFVGVDALDEDEVMAFIWFTKFNITPDTEMNIYFDSSGSMDATLAPLETMRDTLLQDELIQFYNDDATLYNQKVQVQNFSDERTFNQIIAGDLSNPVINIIFQDEAQPVYHPTTFDANNRTSQYETDIAAFRSFISNTNNFRGLIFQVGSGGSAQTAFRAFLQAVQNGVDAYASPYGLADRNQPQFVYDVNNGDTPQYYLDILMDALTAL